MGGGILGGGIIMVPGGGGAIGGGMDMDGGGCINGLIGGVPVFVDDPCGCCCCCWPGIGIRI